MRKAILTLGAGLVAAAAAILPVVSATAASAAAAPHLTGSVNVDNPDLYSGFNNISAPGGGSLTYTNFNYPDRGSGVWSLQKGTPINLHVAVGTAWFNHTLIVDSIEPNGPSALSFTGHGYWNDNPGYAWNATGTVSGNQLVLHLAYTSGNPGYTATDTFTINSDGSASGTATDSSGTAGLTVSLPSGSLFEALAFTSPVNNVQFSPTTPDVQFGSVVPAGHALAGTPFTVKVHDGGNPGVGHDAWSQDGIQYTVDGGNLTVH